MWVPPAPLAFRVSCGTLRELDDTDAALMDVDGTEPADVQAELGGTGDADATMPDPDSPFEPLPPVRWAAETDWPDFPNAGTLLFQEIENPHQLNTFSSDSLQGSVRMLTGEVGTFSGQFSPGEAMATLAESMQWPLRGQSPLCRGRSGPLNGAAQEMCLRWSNEQRAFAEFADAAYVSSVGNTKKGSARSSRDAPVCASLTTVSAATCGPTLAIPHNDWFDGPHFCGARSFMAAAAGYAWLANLVSTRALGVPARRGGSGQPLCGGDS